MRTVNLGENFVYELDGNDVLVVTKNHCSACDATKRLLTSNGVEFNVVNMEEHLEVLESVKAMGFQQAPVVFTVDKEWSGLNQAAIREVADKVQPSAWD